MERNTMQREKILQFLKENTEGHITIGDMLKKLESRVSKATLYRETARLQEKGILKKYTIGEKSVACYKYIKNVNECLDHYHLVCDKCDKLIHEDSIDMQSIKRRIIDSEGFEIDTSNVIFSGICKQCKGDKIK